MSNHFRAKHKPKESSGDKQTKAGNAQKQSSIQEAFGHKTPLSAAKKEEIDNAIEDLIIKSLRPLSLVEDAAFIHLMKVCEPRYKVPARATLVSRLKKRYDVMTHAVKKKLCRLLITVR